MLVSKGFTWGELKNEDIPTSERVDFWRSSGTLKDLQIRAQKMLTEFSKSEDWYENGGAFLPLSVWAQKGWDVERIRKNTPAKDIVETAQGGSCYRVKILSLGERGTRGQLEERQEKADDAKKQRQIMADMEKFLIEQKKQEAASSSSGGAAPASSSSGRAAEEQPAADPMDVDEATESDDDPSSSSSNVAWNCLCMGVCVCVCVRLCV